ncbi:MAG: hypothetical protein AMXMBFR36_30460 [Acidobacteriota bacterium]
MESALYHGTVRHRRFAPRSHRLAYPLFMVYVDLDELASVFAGSLLASTRGPAPLWLRRRDHFGDPDRPWSEVVREAAAERLGRRFDGAVRLLTNPRTLGLRMNPVSFFYLFDRSGALDAVLAEVTNTPWDERHLYAVDARDRSGATAGAAIDARFAKRFHVSPFLPMDLDYRWRLTAPGERLVVHMENRRAERKLFDATLRLERRALDPANLRRTFFEHPAMTFKVLLWIYLHALLLKLKGAPFHPHPKTAAAD